MELQQMRYVVAVAETGSFTRAAGRCFVVQSALSHQVAALERELGVRLFARTSRRVEITAAGEAFLPAARVALESAERAAADAAAAAGEVRGTLRLGVIPTVTALDVPAVLRRLRAAHPRVGASLRMAGSDELVAALRAGELDVAVLGLPDDGVPAGVRHRELARERHVAVVGLDHPLHGRSRVDLARLADEVFADFPTGTPGRAQSDRAFVAAGLRREVAYEGMVTDLLLGLVREGLAVALLPEALVAGREDVVVLRVTRGPSRVQHLAWSSLNPSPAAEAFVRLVDESDATPDGLVGVGRGV
ncbi:LysR family transcriptional regulator [Isoptericola sp. NPDC057653]|uniref:LysR family transcriptional regulator n=1 Tax=Isoptericola sp. NPDC057653 TaxID=3346195 RepID=UPI0036B3C750